MTRDEFTTVDSPVSKPETTTFGKYELIERLGRGGMADVWKARMDGLHGFQRSVVLKRILPHLVADTKARQLFEREARVVSRLSHANIVQVFEFGEVDGEYYLAMEHVDGRDLAALVRAGGGGPASASMIIRDTARALSYGFGLLGDDGAPLRILHRDVSPSNIMVGYDGAVRLLDFGIAKALSDPRDMRTAKGTIRGKFGYIAPEIIEGKDPDARADIFSLGVVLHEMLTGKRLFRGGSDIETLTLVRRANIPPPSALNPLVSNALDHITLKALARDRDQRYASGDELADALDDIAHELRFGPAQLSELMHRHFPRDGGGFGETGAHTVVDEDGSPIGRATAKSVQFEEEPPTSKRRTEVRDVVHHDEPEHSNTVPGHRTGAVPLPAASKKPSVETPAVQKRSAETPVVRARPTHPGPSALTIILAGVLVGALVFAAALLGREMGRARRAHENVTQPR